MKNMKKLIPLLLLSLFIAACGQAKAYDSEKIFSEKNVLIDVRTPSEYQAGHLKKAVNIPYNKIGSEIVTVAPDKEQNIVLYCHSGKRAELAARKLKGMGYINVINAGKYGDLKKQEEELNKSKTDK